VILRHLDEVREVVRASGCSVLAIADMVNAGERADCKDLRVADKCL